MQSTAISSGKLSVVGGGIRKALQLASSPPVASGIFRLTDGDGASNFKGEGGIVKGSRRTQRW